MCDICRNYRCPSSCPAYTAESARRHRKKLEIIDWTFYSFPMGQSREPEGSMAKKQDGDNMDFRMKNKDKN